MTALNWTATGDQDAPIWKAETEAGNYGAGYDCGGFCFYVGNDDVDQADWEWSGDAAQTAADAKAICEAIHAITQ